MFALMLALILSYNGYQRFTAIITQNHEIDALRTARTALTFLEADTFSFYSQNISAQQKIINEWQRIADTQDAMFIYVIKPYDDYNKIRFDINVKHKDSEYDIVPIGYARPTSSDEYKKSYRSLYEGGKEYAIVVRDNGISATGDHVTAMVPIKNSAGVIEGILCVQWQMTDLDSEKILFLKKHDRGHADCSDIDAARRKILSEKAAAQSFGVADSRRQGNFRGQPRQET